MSSLVSYKGLSVLNTASGAGGSAINNDFTALADRIGPCNYTATTDPTGSDNTSSGYYAGSRWFNLTAGTEWVCLASSSSTATWETTTVAADLADYLPLSGGTLTGITTINVADGAPLLNIEGTIADGYSQLGLIGTGHTWQVGVGNASESEYGVADKYYVFDTNANVMRMVVDTSGNVGIGTTSPASLLDVNGVARITSRLLVNGATDDDATALQVSGTVYLGVPNGNDAINIQNSDATVGVNICQKYNGEGTFNNNVDVSDNIGNTAKSAWRMSLSGSDSLDAFVLQHVPAGTTDWGTATRMLTVDNQANGWIYGNLYCDSTGDGSYSVIVGSSDNPLGSAIMVDCSNFIGTGSGATGYGLGNFNSNGGDCWYLIASAGAQNYNLGFANGGQFTGLVGAFVIGNMWNGVNPFVYNPQGTPNLILNFPLDGSYSDNGNVLQILGNTTTTGLIFPVQQPTSSAPAYVKGAIYFDTTLNKLRVGGASGWETVTST